VVVEGVVVLQSLPTQVVQVVEVVLMKIATPELPERLVPLTKVMLEERAAHLTD
jgi:hypothetical protein